MSRATAILFPGQGSQTPDMRDLVADTRPELLATAVEVVGEDPFAAALQRVEFSEPRVPVLSAVTVRRFANPRQELADALTHPVRWCETMLSLRELGAERFVEVGPGRVLTGLAKRTLSDVELVSA